MSIQDKSSNIIDIGPGEFPFYQKEQENKGKVTTDTAMKSNDAKTVSGIQAVTATVKGPNVLVATDPLGYMPVGVQFYSIAIGMLFGS